jgi:hypothetical protein
VTGEVPGHASWASVLSWACGGGGALVTRGAGPPASAEGPHAAASNAMPTAGIPAAAALRRNTGALLFHEGLSAAHIKQIAHKGCLIVAATNRE